VPVLPIDVINNLAFSGSRALDAQAEPMAVRLAALKRRATASPSPRISQRVKPTIRDYFVLKEPCWRALKPEHAEHSARLQIYLLTFRFSFVIALFSWVFDF
jgi:hypothetical protein